MRDYHDFERKGALPAENLDQVLVGTNIACHYALRHRKYEVNVRITIDFDNADAFEPDVVFFRKDKNRKWGKAIVVIEIEDQDGFERCKARCQEHLAMNPELLEAFAYNIDKKRWVRYVQGNPVLYAHTSYSEVLKLYLKDLKYPCATTTI